MLALILAALPVLNPSACEWPVDRAVAQVQSDGGQFLDLIDVPGAGYDQLIIVEMPGAVLVSGVLNGCLIRPLAPIAPLRHDVPASLTQHM